MADLAKTREVVPARTGFDALWQLTGDALVLLDGRGRIVDLSSVAVGWFGPGAAALEGTAFVTLVASGSRVAFRRFTSSLALADRAASLDTTLSSRAGSGDATLHGVALPGMAAGRVLLRISAPTRDAAGSSAEQRTRRALKTQEAERCRLAREIHDDLGQLLVGVRLELDLLRLSPRVGPPDLGRAFAGAYVLLDQAHESVRRLCRGLRPPVIEPFGLVPALQVLVEDVRAPSVID